LLELRGLNSLKALSIFSLGALIVLLSTHILGNDNKLKECTFSKTLLIKELFDCRQISDKEVNYLNKYWSSEDDAELCHYFYFPIADPMATKELLLENYLIMQKEINAREVDCKQDHRNIFWYRGKNTKSMLEKLIIKYDLDLKLD